MGLGWAGDHSRTPGRGERGAEQDYSRTCEPGERGRSVLGRDCSHTLGEAWGNGGRGTGSKARGGEVRDGGGLAGRGGRPHTRGASCAQGAGQGRRPLRSEQQQTESPKNKTQLLFFLNLDSVLFLSSRILSTSGDFICLSPALAKILGFKSFCLHWLFSVTPDIVHFNK